MCAREFRSLAKADDARNIFRAWATVAFGVATEKQRLNCVFPRT